MKLEKVEGKANRHFFRHPVTKILYVRLSKKGRGRLEKSLGTTELDRKARQRAEELIYKFLGQRNPKTGRALVGELFPLWLEQKRIKRPSTFARYQLSWTHLKPYIENLLPEDLTEEWWSTKYVPGKRSLDPKRRFFNDRKTLRMFLKSLVRRGVISTFDEFSKVDDASKAGKVYSDEEVARLLNASRDDLRLQILMAVTMGMRSSEILLLPTAQVDRERRLITLFSENTKTKKARTFGVSDEVWPLLEARLGHQSGFVFPSRTGEPRPIGKNGNKSAWKGAKKRAGVTGRFHDLRHTFLTRAFKTSTNPALICTYAGLSLEVAQRTYLHFTPEDTRPVSQLVRVGAVKPENLAS